MATATAITPGASASNTSSENLPVFSDTPKTLELLPKSLTKDFKKDVYGRGVLIPLKTVSEVAIEHTVIHVYITRAPTKCANAILTYVSSLFDDDRCMLMSHRGLNAKSANGEVNTLQHLRRAAKPSDLPAHLKTQFMNDDAAGRQIHTAKSSWVYILVGECHKYDPEQVKKTLSAVEGMDEDIFLTAIPVPELAPYSQVQASLWSSQFWPCVYRKSNPLGPHPSAVARDTEEIRHDASAWMALAHKVARQAQVAKIGEPIGAVIVQRLEGRVEVVGLAGDARWHRQGGRGNGPGNPMAHAVLRAISMVAQKLVRAERREKGIPNEPPNLSFDALEDKPILELEKACFVEEHPNTGGYLCHGLELYVTHEPCVQCSMAILHSRMGRMVFCQHMPQTGGLSSDDRPNGGGRGLGLFWRRELNWSALAWEWERDGIAALPAIPPTTHV